MTNQIAFRDMIIGRFQQEIPNFGDRDVSLSLITRQLSMSYIFEEYLNERGTHAFSVLQKF